jgi:Rps23 Pro-64 3,4-dihydroxylase Tpa1-like proline 4-hydroxylase
MTGNENSAVVFDRLPPYHIMENFLGQALIDRLIDHVLENQGRFEESTVGSSEGRIDQEVRVSSILRDFGPLKTEIKSRFKAVFPEVLERLRMPDFELYGTEREIVAHGNGAFYNRHIDTFTGAGEFSVRALTAVYYFHAQPKNFQGGELRLLPLRNNQADSIYLDVEPINDRLLLFPSWVPHRVMPVISDSADFRDSRFAINCWYHKLRA